MNKNTQNWNNTLVSFALMVLVWTFLFGSWQFAALFLVLLGVHEMGHFVVARALGMNVSAPVFTPLGALINMREQPANAFDEAVMAYGGPFIGSLGALAAVVLGHVTGFPLLIAAGKAAFWLNLFNLIPLSPMDGGRISMAISRHLWVLGVLLFGGLLYVSNFDLWTLLIAVFIGRAAFDDVQMRGVMAQQQPEYFAIGAAKRVGVTVAYAGLIAALLFALVSL
jgi:Zn-dependent protease